MEATLGLLIGILVAAAIGFFGGKLYERRKQEKSRRV